MSSPEDKQSPRERRRSTDAQMLEALQRVELQLVGLREDVQARPTKSEVKGSRRLAVLGVVALIFALAQVIDLHSESCGPGHRSEVVIDDLVTAITDDDPNTSMGEVFLNAADRGTPSDVCGLTFPTHTHDNNSWPEKQHVTGLAVYLLVLAGMGLWAYKGFDKKQDHPNEGATNGSDHPAVPDDAAVETAGGGEGSQGT